MNDNPGGVQAPTDLPTSVADTLARLQAHQYLADRALGTAVHLALQLRRPLLLEGEPGTGKTRIAQALAAMLQRPLIRLQCHEGLDLSGAAYEWNYGRQMLAVRLAGRGAAASAAAGPKAADAGAQRDALAAELFGQRYLIPRALLKAIDPANLVAPVLLIDELDRADAAFEALLLELLGEFRLTIPELGTVQAVAPPIVVLTSNRTREVHDALKRRCIYHWLDYPDADRERAILESQVPGLRSDMAQALQASMGRLKALAGAGSPAQSERLAWAQTLQGLDAIELTPERVRDTLGALLQAQAAPAAAPMASVHMLAELSPGTGQ